VPRLGFSSERFTQAGVVVSAGQTVSLAIESRKTNLGVVGDGG
jgi:hypothetical protein